MKPIKTPITLLSLAKPEAWDAAKQGECQTLYVHKYSDGYISYWKPTFLERVRVLCGAKIRLAVIGNGHPPVWIDIDPDGMKESL